MRSRQGMRNGATVVEAALVLPLLLLLVLGLIDLALLAFRYQVLHSSAARGVRSASVHGSLATEKWGPAGIGPLPASSEHPLVVEIAQALVGVDPSDVLVMLDWPDGDNEPACRVRLRLSSSYRFFSIPGVEIPIEVSAMLPIAH